MCNHSPNREAAMTVIKPGVHCDPCLAPLVQALNADGAGLPTTTSQRFGTQLATIASCCGHGWRPGWIALADGRWLVIARDRAELDKIEEAFPYGINGEVVQR